MIDKTKVLVYTTLTIIVVILLGMHSHLFFGNKEVETKIEIKEGYSYNILEKVDELYQERIQDDLERVPQEYHKKVLALCWTESNLRYDVKHKGVNDKTTKGICGIKENFWINLLNENDAEVNSLYAGYLVLKQLEMKRDGDFRGALKLYKGAFKNTKSIDKVYNTLDEIY